MVLGCTLFLLYHHRRNNHTEAHPLMLFFFAIAHSDVWRWRESCLSLPSHQSASCVQQFLCDCRHKSVLKAWCVYKNQHSTREVCSISRNTAHSGGPEDPTDTQHRRWFDGCSCIVLSNFTCLVTFKCRVCGCVPPMQLFCKTGAIYFSSSIREWAERCVGKRSVGLTSPPLSDHNVNSGKSHSVSMCPLPFPYLLVYSLSCCPSMALSSCSFPYTSHARLEVQKSDFDCDVRVCCILPSDTSFWIWVNPLLNADSLITGCSRLKCDWYLAVGVTVT